MPTATQISYKNPTRIADNTFYIVSSYPVQDNNNFFHCVQVRYTICRITASASILSTELGVVL